MTNSGSVVVTLPADVPLARVWRRLDRSDRRPPVPIPAGRHVEVTIPRRDLRRLARAVPVLATVAA